MHVKAFLEWQGFKSDFPCLFPGKTCLSKGATSMTSWRTPSQPLGLTCRCEQTKHSKHPVLWFCSTTRCKKPLSTLSIKMDIEGTGPTLPPWPRWWEQDFDERLLPARGTLWLCSAQRRGLTAAAGARPRHAGVREKLSQWALNSWISPLWEEEKPAKGFQKARKAKNSASHS